MVLIYLVFVNDGDMIKFYFEFKKVEFWKKGVFFKEVVKIICDDLF